MTTSILRPPSTPPRALTSSAAIFTPRTMNWPADASPGGDSGVNTPILTGPCAKLAGAAPQVRTIAASTARARMSQARSLMSSSASPFLQRSLVDVDTESGSIERENGAVGVAHRLARDVPGEEQRAEELAAPRDRGRGQRDLQIGGGAQRGLDHAAHVAAETRGVRDARDRHRVEQAGGLRDLEA